ncbi:putative suppressive immunomodulating factor [Trypanosoma rangeli]|uniref:Putative suppressive immunomodulating factor n=1 Tax=Trypanosoma rangeli TaxID=5698 RepID=A0A3R7LVX7_TRYRA|nr:putative suppressive immunomodulating factor [Trypanosoma rangeli]RNF04343.1 putative suppressive immunomodulating factor [Trypanosoma rangeli]|eukprot:RNF04343.1 putative suppressive immunomodulating factor [Trypanosoma rangeli]
MSSVVTLRELDTLEKEDQPLLERFERCRHDVVRVSASSILHDCIAVTTKGGFVELINIDTGAFRLFLSHLGDTPLESLLRCFSLVPALYAACGRHHLLYSLAYSNELLLADMEQGTVEVLARFHSRPSVVFCDGDYMLCGEGCGQVALWRAPCDAAGAKLLWRQPVFADTVLCISVQRDYVFCASVDYHVYVLALESGEIVAALPHEPAPAVALQPAAVSQVSRTLTVLFLPEILSVYSPPPLVEDAPATAKIDNSAWSCTAVLRLDVQISCASCFAELMALGTASGVVLLLGIEATSGELVERVRFDVGFSVVGIQMFSNGKLAVVTSAGDVWKWAIHDLLPREGDGAEEEEEEAENLSVPQPHTKPLDPTQTVPPASGDRVGVSDEEEIVVEMGDEASSSVSSSLSMSCHSVRLESNTADVYSESSEVGIEGAAAWPWRPNFDSDTTPSNPIDGMTETGVARGKTSAEDTAAAGDAAGQSLSLAAAVVITNDEEDDGDGSGGNDDNGYGGKGSEHSFQPSSISIVAGTVGAADTLRSVSFAPPHACLDMDPHSTSHVVDCPTSFSADPSACRDGVQLQREGGVMVTAPVSNDAQYPSAFMSSACSRALRSVLRGTDLGPPAVITGLRSGKRMDPRKARHVVENSHAEVVLPHPESQSSTVLVNHRQSLEEAKFDYAEYAKAHSFKAEALKYRYPVKLPVHGLHAQVFAAAEPRLQDHSNGNVENAESDDKRKKQRQQQAIIDDLMNVTFQNFTRRKDTALEEERRHGGPDIRQHLCDNLLFGPVDPSATVLFQETRVQLTVPKMLFLPMPLPPTPSVL